jgi:hypothetical protein
MPDVIEAASTGRAKCRHCSDKIDKGALRFGESVPNAFGEGDAVHWFHLACAAESRPQKVEPVLKSSELEIPEREGLEQVIADGIANPKLLMIKHADWAPTGRATCQHCREKIEKATLRVGIEREPDPMGMSSVSYVHARCIRQHVGSAGLVAKLRRASARLAEEERAALIDVVESSPE